MGPIPHLERLRTGDGYRGREHEQLYIDPEECIDCDACVEACPVDAITSEDQVPEEWQGFIEINAACYRNRR